MRRGSHRGHVRRSVGRWREAATRGRPAGGLEELLESGAAYGLTERERAVARLLIAGHTNRQIATTLWLSPHTVSDHVKNVFGKLGVTTRGELTARLFFDHYLPRQMAEVPIGGDGWYIDPR